MPSLADRWHSAILKNNLDLMRFDAQLRTEIIAMLNQLGRDLVAELANAELDTPRTDWQRARLRKLLEEAQARVSGVYGDIADQHQAGLADAVEAQSGSLVLALNKAAGADLLSPVKWTAEQLAALAGDTLVRGAPIKDWWARQSVDLQQAFADQMRLGMLQGEGVGQLSSRVRDLKMISQRNAEALVRTSAMAVNNAAHMALWDANSDIIKEYQWCSTLDPRTCVACGQRDGEVWLPHSGHTEPPLHWNCFVGGTLVESPEVLRGFERAYTGDVVIIRTAAGNEVTCTPNHPILTDAGWVAAGLIKKGQKVVQRLPGDGFIGPAPNAVEVKTRIEDVVGSFLGSRGMVPVTVPLTPEDFHGDAIDHEVATVWTNGKLPDEGNTGNLQHLCKTCLQIRGSRGLAGLSRLRRQGKGLYAGDVPSGGDVRISDEGAAFFGGHPAHADQHGLGTASDRLSVILEDPHDYTTGDSELIRHCLDAIAAFMPSEDEGFINQKAVGASDSYAGANEVGSERGVLLPTFIRKTVERFSRLVAFDEVLEVRYRPGFVGHVYNLETEGNWYVASNIITHNCRCAAVPITKSWEELATKNKDLARELDNMPKGMRSSMGGPVSADTTWESWLKGQSRSVQEDVLGPTRLKMWDSGKLTLHDLVDQRGNELTLEELKVR